MLNIVQMSDVKYVKLTRCARQAIFHIILSQLNLKSLVFIETILNWYVFHLKYVDFSAIVNVKYVKLTLCARRVMFDISGAHEH